MWASVLIRSPFDPPDKAMDSVPSDRHDPNRSDTHRRGVVTTPPNLLGGSMSSTWRAGREGRGLKGASGDLCLEAGRVSRLRVQ